MPTLTHNKDAAQEQKHEATADARSDKSAEHDKLDRGLDSTIRLSVVQMERAAGLHMRAKEMLQKALDSAENLSQENNKAVSQIKAQLDEHRPAADSVGPAGPGDATARMSDELQRSQREALTQSQANEWQSHFDQVHKSLEDAAQSVVFAAESMLARHEATESTFRNELVAEMDAARDRDQPAGSMTAGDVLARQQQREEVVAGELETLAKRQLDEVGRLQSLVSDMREAIRSFTQDAQANVAESAGRSNAQQLQDAQERLQRFNEERRDIVALRNVWDGRLSDVEAMNRTWDKAAAGPAEELERKWDKLDEKGRREAAAKAYETARETFWGLLNKQADDDTREVRMLLDRVGVEWQKGKNAPLLDGITVTLDHVADKAAHPELALDASNLRFLTSDDNSARGNKYSVTDRRNVDFVSSEEQQARNAKSRDRAAGKRFDRGHATHEALVIAEAKQRLKQEQDRAAAPHQKVVNEAVENRDKKADELHASKLQLLNGEDENLRRERQDTRLDDLNRFLNAALKQSGQLQQFELSMHERQQQELSQVLKWLAGEPTMTAQEVLEEIRNLELRFAAERSEFENLWREMDTLRNLDEGRMLRAIYEAASREAQEENIKRALERQQQTQQDQDRRLEELARERDAHD